MRGTWGETALNVIHERYTSIKAAQPHLADDDVLRMVSLHYYPFGERAYWPYKAWLKAMKQYREQLAHGPLFDKGTDDLPLFSGE